MMEGSGSVPPNNGSGPGTGRPKNLQIRIRNTGFFLCSQRLLYNTIWNVGVYLNYFLTTCIGEQEGEGPPHQEPEQQTGRLHWQGWIRTYVLHNLSHSFHMPSIPILRKYKSYILILQVRLLQQASDVWQGSKTRVQRLYSQKTWCMKPPAGVDYNSLLSHSQLPSQLFTPTTKGKGWSEEDLSYWLRTFASVCWFPKQRIRKRRVLSRGREGMKADLISLNRHFYGAWALGNPVSGLTFTSCLSWL